MLNLLLIEDDPDIVQPIIDRIIDEYDDIKCTLTSFDDAENEIKRLNPEIVSLDMLKDGASAEPLVLGDRIDDFIWDHNFCSIIVFSANPNTYSEEHYKHPLIKCIQKGKDAVTKYLRTLDELIDSARMIKSVKNEVIHVLSDVLKDVFPHIKHEYSDGIDLNSVITRICRRRLAAKMDLMMNNGGENADWEQYIFPKLYDSLLLGDIIKNNKDSDISSYRIVLTPSCDLVNNEKRKPKVDQILTAKFVSVKDVAKTLKISGSKKKEKVSKIESEILTHGYKEHYIPIPELKEKIPDMFVNLKDLELIPVDKVYGPSAIYSHIASIDSPFRENISWAYQQTACRVGLPERDIGSWATRIYEQANESTK